MNQDIFGAPLAVDPAVALPAVTLEPLIENVPVHKTQFVIEIAGPRTVPASSIRALLEPHWRQALPNAQVFVMAGADQHWRPLEPNDGCGAYDSVALAWDMITSQGELSAGAAQGLWHAAEDFARQVSRRAIAMPIPQDVPQNVGVLKQLRESLDVGVNLSVAAVFQPFPEKEVWRVAAALGLEYGPRGTFIWKGSGREEPLFEASPGEDYERFLLSQVQSGVAHSVLGLGFSVPLCPNPMAAMDGCLRAGFVFAHRLEGRLLDEDENPVTETSALGLKRNLELAADALRKAGFPAGSVEALRLFAG